MGFQCGCVELELIDLSFRFDMEIMALVLGEEVCSRKACKITYNYNLTFSIKTWPVLFNCNLTCTKKVFSTPWHFSPQKNRTGTRTSHESEPPTHSPQFHTSVGCGSWSSLKSTPSSPLSRLLLEILKEISFHSFHSKSPLHPPDVPDWSGQTPAMKSVPWEFEVRKIPNLGFSLHVCCVSLAGKTGETYWEIMVWIGINDQT